MSALTGIGTYSRFCTYSDKERGEGKDHHQALLALARRRVNVLWALLSDHTAYQLATSVSTPDVNGGLPCRPGTTR